MEDLRLINMINYMDKFKFYDGVAIINFNNLEDWFAKRFIMRSGANGIIIDKNVLEEIHKIDKINTLYQTFKIIMEARDGFYIEIETDEMNLFIKSVEPYRINNKEGLDLTKDQIYNIIKAIKRKRKIARLIAEYDSGI